VGTNYERIFYKDYERLFEQNNKLSEELRAVRYNYQLLAQRYETAERRQSALKDGNEELQNKLQDALREVERLKCLLNIDGTNSGTPTSKTPLNKAKVIPNSREPTDRKRGGQQGHAKKKLERFKESEVNERVEHPLSACPECHGRLEQTGTIEKDVLDYKIIVEKTRHVFTVYHCACCGKEVHAEIPNNLKEGNQYGPQVQSLALTLMNMGNVSMNKVRKIIGGFTGNEINLSEGYLAKLQKRAAAGAEKFCDELRKELLKQSIVYWDDTVIMVNTNRACLRYYGTELLALYKAHLHKDKAGLDEDNILRLLPPETTVVHDHNKVNYNDEYSFQNAECNEHLIRDLKKVIDNLASTWAQKLITLLTETNREREKKKEAGFKAFHPDYLAAFFDQFNGILVAAFDENKQSPPRYYQSDEAALIRRILEYKNNYLLWVTDFDVPFTNNLSERSLRDAKSKMKISGQFQNEKTASYYAHIKSYIETCNRNAVNGFYALHRLCMGSPLALNELLPPPDDGL
jgi:hypothetical protein